MQIQNVEIILFTSILFSVLNLTLADFEYTCNAQNYSNFERQNPGRISACVSHLANYISRTCRNEFRSSSLLAPGFSKASYQRDSDVFVDAELAATLLRLRQTSDPYSPPSYIGMDCECCLNRCSNTEFLQYCNMYRPRRRRRRDVTSASANFKSDAIDQLYKEIESTERIDTDRLPKLPMDHLDQIRKWKIKNIRKRLLFNLFGSDDKAKALPSSDRVLTKSPIDKSPDQSITLVESKVPKQQPATDPPLVHGKVVTRHLADNYESDTASKTHTEHADVIKPKISNMINNSTSSSSTNEHNHKNLIT